MVAPELPRPPDGLRSGGRSLWRKVIENDGHPIRFRPDELRILHNACQTVDLCDRLDAEVRSSVITTGAARQAVLHRAVAELRAQRSAMTRMLKSLDVPDA